MVACRRSGSQVVCQGCGLEFAGADFVFTGG